MLFGRDLMGRLPIWRRFRNGFVFASCRYHTCPLFSRHVCMFIFSCCQLNMRKWVWPCWRCILTNPPGLWVKRSCRKGIQRGRYGICVSPEVPIEAPCWVNYGPGIVYSLNHWQKGTKHNTKANHLPCHSKQCKHAEKRNQNENTKPNTPAQFYLKYFIATYIDFFCKALPVRRKHTQPQPQPWQPMSWHHAGIFWSF